MSSLVQINLLIAAFFLFLFLTGFWTSRSGKPGNVVLPE